MVRQPLATVALLAAVALLAGCFGDDDGEGDATPTATATAAAPTATATPTPTATATATVSPSATPTGSLQDRPQYGVWSVDAGSLEVAVLHESDSHASLTSLGDDGVWLNYADDRRATHFGLDGRVLEQREGFYFGEPTGPICEQDELGDLAARVDGVEYEANCGWPFSPGGSKMLYTVEMGGGAGVPRAEYRSWVLDLDTGTSTEIEATLRHCGGCDGIAGPSWSSSGRYLLVGETYTGPDSSVYLYDTESDAVRRVAVGTSVNGAFFQPVWVHGEDAFLRPRAEGGTAYEQADGSSVLQLPEVPWPARPIGAPDWAVSTGSGAQGLGRVVIADLSSGDIVASWPGRLPGLGSGFSREIWESGVGEVDGQPVAVIEATADCSGSRLQHPALDAAGVCLEGAESAMLSPDASQVAFARVVGSADFLKEWEIAVYEVESGRERALDRMLLDHLVPLLRWTPSGGHLIVVWPRPGL